MFYKIDPSQRQLKFDLSADGFLKGDRLQIFLRGDFQPTPSGSAAQDNYQNTFFRLGNGENFDASYAPVRVKATSLDLVAINDDRPLIDNIDPDGDYGVMVRLAAFTSGDDFFRFGSRTELPSVVGSIYKAGAGDDTVVMPNAPISGFNAAKVFQMGAGDDEARAGNLDMKVNFAAGTDTLVFKNAEIDWSIKENRDNDAVLVVTDADTRYQVSHAEILKDGGDTDPLAKFYFTVARDRHGDCTITFFEDGERVARATGSFDTDYAGGRYEAMFRKGGQLGERIELIDVDGGDHVAIRQGGGANPRGDFVTTGSFINAVFDHIDETYADAGSSVPWQHNSFVPEVPATVELTDAGARTTMVDDLLA